MFSYSLLSLFYSWVLFSLSLISLCYHLCSNDVMVICYYSLQSLSYCLLSFFHLSVLFLSLLVSLLSPFMFYCLSCYFYYLLLPQTFLFSYFLLPLFHLWVLLRLREMHNALHLSVFFFFFSFLFFSFLCQPCPGYWSQLLFGPCQNVKSHICYCTTSASVQKTDSVISKSNSSEKNCLRSCSVQCENYMNFQFYRY